MTSAKGIKNSADVAFDVGKRYIAVKRGNADDFDARVGECHQNGKSVINTGIGIDNHWAR